MRALRYVLYALCILFVPAMLGNGYYRLVPDAGNGFWLLITTMAMGVVIFIISDVVDKRPDARWWQGFHRNLVGGYMLTFVSLQSLFITIFEFQRAVVQQEPMGPEASSEAMSYGWSALILLVVGLYQLYWARKIAIKAKAKAEDKTS